MEIYEMTALEIAQKIKDREISCEDAVNSVAESIENKDGVYNCYTSFDKEAALEKRRKLRNLWTAVKQFLRLQASPLQ